MNAQQSIVATMALLCAATFYGAEKSIADLHDVYKYMRYIQEAPGISREDRFASDTSIALYASWNEVIKQPDEIKSGATSFVSFFEGRVRVETPAWWHRLLQSGVITNGSCHFPSKRGSLAARWHEGDDFKLSGPSSIGLSGESLILNWEQRSISFPRGLVDEGGGRSCSRQAAVAAAVKDRNCYIVFNSTGDSTGAGQLICIDVNAKVRKWSAILRTGAAYPASGGGASEAFSEIVAMNGVVCVFEASSFGLSISGFDESTGENRIHFFTRLLNADELEDGI